VYFKTNKRAIHEYPNLCNYTRDLYQTPGAALNPKTCTLLRTHVCLCVPRLAVRPRMHCVVKAVRALCALPI
jgi:hypothetical protein